MVRGFLQGQQVEGAPMLHLPVVLRQEFVSLNLLFHLQAPLTNASVQMHIMGSCKHSGWPL